MKFGQHLERESVPEWNLRMLLLLPRAQLIAPRFELRLPVADHIRCCVLSDNLDYNSLKHEIKVHTMRDQATAMAIPGHTDEALNRFEQGLFMELGRQHERLQLFVCSKADEISRRLGSLPHQPVPCLECASPRVSELTK